MSHTPGPWQACGDSKCPCRQVWSMPGDCPVFTGRPDCNVLVGMAHHKWGDGPNNVYGEIPAAELEANARLIAAAPELLEAAESLERVIVELYPGHAEPEPGHKEEFSAVWAAVTSAREAIAKAKGGTA